MSFAVPLEKMSRVEKLRAMEALWADLSQTEAQFDSPEWHAQALREAETALQSGRATFSKWDDAKQRLRDTAAEPR